MVGFPLRRLAKSTRYFGCALAALFIGQSLVHAQLSGNGNFVVPLSDPMVSLRAPVLTNGQVQLTLNGEVGVSYVIESSPDFVNWTPVATNSDSGTTRTITLDAGAAHYYRASRAPLPLATFALAARGNMNLLGNGQTTDSFNSSDPTSSTDGRYDKTKALTNGAVASAAGMVFLGNHLVGGDLYIGPAATVSSNTLTHQVLGTIHTNATVAFPDAALPNVSWLDAPISDSVHDFTTNGYYLVNDSSNLIVEPGVTVILNVTTTPTFQSLVKIHGGVTNSGTAYIFLNGCTNAYVYRNLADDASNRAKNLCYIGLPSLISVLVVDLSTNIPCVIYAPSASATINGGGLSDNFIGSLTLGSLQMNGHYQFHFDEDLLTNGPCR